MRAAAPHQLGAAAAAAFYFGANRWAGAAGTKVLP
jgi:hypothetical protein